MLLLAPLWLTMASTLAASARGVEAGARSVAHSARYIRRGHGLRPPSPLRSRLGRTIRATGTSDERALSQMEADTERQEEGAEFERMIWRLQDTLVGEMESLEGPEGAKFNKLPWQREPSTTSGGQGRTCVLEDGSIFEKAAIGVSIIHGELSPERAKAMSSRGRPAAPGGKYSAAALSLVFHPKSPKVPTFRADVRMFSLGGEDTWYGGGADLTPNYLDEEDAKDFHSFWKDVCDRHGTSFYADFKKQCDEYFYLPARKEHRGIGGIFFDDIPGSPGTLALVRDVAESWMGSYRPIVLKHAQEGFTEEEREWQLIRRSRYAEFNMLWDRGVRFGLLSGGDIDRIMVSAPPLVRWKFDATPPANTPEAEMQDVLKNPREWVKARE